MQTLRSTFPISVWYQSSSVFVLFPVLILGFLTPLLLAAFKCKRTFIFLSSGLALTRLIEVVAQSPAIDLYANLIGVALFSLSLPLIFKIPIPSSGKAGEGSWVGGIILGLAIQNAIQGLFWTDRLGSSHHPLAIVIQSLLLVITLALLRSNRIVFKSDGLDRSWRQASVLLIFGPFLLFQMLFLQNQGLLSEVLDVNLPLAFLLTSLGNVLAIIGFQVGLSHRQSTLILRGLIGFSLSAAVYLLNQSSFALLPSILFIHFMFGWWLSRTISTDEMPKIGFSIRTSIAIGLSQALFVLIMLLLFGNLLFPVAVDNNLIFAVLALGMGCAVFFADRASTDAKRFTITSPLILRLTLVVFATAFVHWAIQKPLNLSSPDTRLPLRVMTYNIHSAVSYYRGQELEAVAEVIESSGSDIVALQEVSRGWIMSGGIDMVAWLSERLGMESVFTGTADRLWGVAILSRYPIIESGSGPLPGLDALIPRGYIWAKVDVGAPSPLFIINTHLHHVSDREDVRIAQVSTLLEIWDTSERTILLGDMNARPGSEEMNMIAHSGFLDAWAEAGTGSEYTLPAHIPSVRVDWIWYTLDLQSIETQVLSTTASDHLPVLATIDYLEE
jgi:endonuclease/exonuclease/phosphatase family metal-dependent hydrolase